MRHSKRLFCMLSASALAFCALPQRALLPAPALTAFAEDEAAEGSWTYTVDEETQTVSVTGYAGEETELVIPSEIGGLPVTAVGGAEASGFAGAEKITIPDSVKLIGERAFYGCTGLTDITISDSVTTIEAFAFQQCTGLTSITIPDSVTSIAPHAFLACSGLTDNRVSENNPAYCDEDGVLLSADRTKLIIYPKRKKGAYTVPDSVTDIGESAFERCRGLTGFVIPNSAEEIRQDAFSGCTNLTDIVIPDSVTVIEDFAFFECTELKSVTIPDSVDTIGIFNSLECSEIRGMPGSCAESYASQCRIPFVPLGSVSVHDLNGDGAVSAADAVLFARFFSGDETLEPDTVQAILQTADFNGDGLLTLSDVYELLRKYADPE